MTLGCNAMINLYSVIVLSAIYLFQRKSDDRGSILHNLFVAMLLINILTLLADTLGRFEGNPGTIFPIINAFGNFFLHVFNLILPSAWFIYAYYQVYRKEHMVHRLLFVFAGINIVNIVLHLFSQSYNWFYYLDEQNIYHRGPLYFAEVLITMAIMLAVVVMIFIRKKYLNSKQYYSLLAVPLIPVIGFIFQWQFPILSIQFNSTVISLVLIFLNVQNEQLFTDYLTGLNNRKKLDQYMKKRMENQDSSHPVSAILISIRDFKHINEVFGAKTGDVLLMGTAKILKSSLLGKFFIARLGGGEFIVVMDESSEKKIKNIMRLIQENATEYKPGQNFECELILDMGFTVCKSPKMKLTDFYLSLDNNLKKSIKKERIHFS